MRSQEEVKREQEGGIMQELNITYMPVEALEPYTGNARAHGEEDVEAIKKSIEKYGFNDPIGIWSDHNVIVEGHGRLQAAVSLGIKKVPCIRLDHLTDDQRREYAIMHNKTAELSTWDFEALKKELEALSMEGFEDAFAGIDEMADEELRKQREFEERMAAGENMDEDEEYQKFLEKFETKKTTDDCYTPPKVYDVVAEYVVKRYGRKREDFVRPFYPGGDYQKEKYPKGCVVVDNPPFSILSEILAFYHEHNVDFFLFAPALTLFSSSSSSCAIGLGVGVIYENGANVSTSFLTSLEKDQCRARTDPQLYEDIEQAVKETLAEKKRTLPKYSYPDEVLTSHMLSRYSKYGIEYAVTPEETEVIKALDEQKKSGKTIYGGGYLLSERAAAERAAAERAAAERAAAERAAAERWRLSDREREIVRRLGGA